MEGGRLEAAAGVPAAGWASWSCTMPMEKPTGRLPARGESLEMRRTWATSARLLGGPALAAVRPDDQLAHDEAHDEEQDRGLDVVAQLSMVNE